MMKSSRHLNFRNTVLQNLSFFQMASPVLDPMVNAGQRISQSFGLPDSSLSMNDYISRTVDGGNLPLVAGVALAAISKCCI